MSNFNTIQNKLEAFIKRYYINELLKGVILFFAIGLLYFLFTLFLEHMLWLSTTARTFLFWLFIAVEFGLLVKFIFIPLAKLFKLQKGIDYHAASKIIGTHFPEVNDKLLNVLQLNEADSKSELLLASIEQKASELKPVPFKLAVNFKKNLGYLKYAAIPVVILLLTFFTGNFNWFSESYNRVVHYKTAYEPPAPFQFFVVNENLQAIENTDFKLLVKTAGDVTPESAQISYNNETYFLQQKAIGEFEYVFTQPKEAITFQLMSNDVTSKPYTIDVVETPSLLSFKMVLDYPSYTKKQDEVLKSTGNALVPEGTQIKWQLQTKSTNKVQLFAKDTTQFISISKGVFEASKRLYSKFDYTLSTSNKDLQNYENLAFNIDVVKDEYPEIDIKVEKDSLDLQSLYFYGQISDDYGFSKLQLVYYPVENEANKQMETIPVSGSNISDFISAFPNNLEISEGVAYELYFQVFDNDRVNKFKSVKSSVFSYRKRTEAEEADKNLKEQGETIKDLNKSLTRFDEQEKKLQELTNTQKEKSELNFNDKKKLENFFKRQKEQDQMMQNFNKKLKDNLEEFQKDEQKEDQFKEDLKERLNENEEKLKQDEKLLDEIEKLHEKINNEDLIKKLDELAKQNKNKKRSLEQLLELTKRFYVEKKLEKLNDDLLKLAEEQEQLSEKSEDENTKEKQDELNKKFEDYKKELEDLEKESKDLKKPIEIPRDKLDEQEVEDEQQKASDALEEKEADKKESEQENKEGSEEKNEPSKKKDSNSEKAKKSQKKAAQKMKQMSQQMQSAMQGGSDDQIQEDAEMLRQILDNLVLFSFDQEAVMNQFKSIESNNNKFASYLKKQQNLREHFEHVDDSLFALSLRQPKLSEEVNKEITEVYYNIDKALALLAENQLYQGVSNQQFVVTAANNLANFLSDVLDNMEESMSMSAGKGGQGDMQLPDIIMSQEELNKMMEEGMKKGEKGSPKEGDGKRDGEGEKKGEKEGEKEGDKSKEGDKGKEGKGKGKDKGEDGEQNGGDGEGNGEDENGLLFEIYQKQQQLRQALQERWAKEGKSGNGDALVRKMEDIELELLNKGFTQQTLQKMMALKHQLLKLEKATFQQGEDNKRESETNKNNFDNNSNNQIPTAKQYFQTTEILNRQALPLQQVYKKKVQEYFKKEND
ncbi:DUF4175 family protein [Algibacter amylolyticus]|uniref:DUF4175 family protein n=1 Tax=Algibacter amylolyticus TaxID=1608400 RepID=UPI001617A874|nr:DUF4175 family protein [Algibacter amylolyticus]MBB5266633.1 hypothetical protein [Algibacter amylolyticus]